jgi:hypothetical protein
MFLKLAAICFGIAVALGESSRNVILDFPLFSIIKNAKIWKSRLGSPVPEPTRTLDDKWQPTLGSMRIYWNDVRATCEGEYCDDRKQPHQ